mmetsp:Transcript_46741/g.99718  ORF Transcript_46741/g.99718 Transcript_46741/m.99718 type:complete len:234 (+) Transcript_46741:466-1167(+)
MELLYDPSLRKVVGRLAVALNDMEGRLHLAVRRAHLHRRKACFLVGWRRNSANSILGNVLLLRRGAVHDACLVNARRLMKAVLFLDDHSLDLCHTLCDVLIRRDVLLLNVCDSSLTQAVALEETPDPSSSKLGLLKLRIVLELVHRACQLRRPDDDRMAVHHVGDRSRRCCCQAGFLVDDRKDDLVQLSLIKTYVDLAPAFPARPCHPHPLRRCPAELLEALDFLHLLDHLIH